MEMLPETASNFLTMLCWNIQNPSLDRAVKQLQWISPQSIDVIILTECKRSAGCLFLEQSLWYAGYEVTFSECPNREYGTMIASKHQMKVSCFASSVQFLNSRVGSVSLQLPGLRTQLELIGVYVPSRDASTHKINRKKQFLSELLRAFNSDSNTPYRVCCGDFNVLEPNHYPKYSFFKSWEYDFYTSLLKLGFSDAFRNLHPKAFEYSWVGRKGDGYRYDHFLVSDEILPKVKQCNYRHEPRDTRLSDHSAIFAEIDCRE
ncbi:MAG: hypothetical protein JOZ57_17305 [Abitibacteriaceae bacterium]|nr:hypothetical protein [Abditibacteriaceae bacterium]